MELDFDRRLLTGDGASATSISATGSSLGGRLALLDFFLERDFLLFSFRYGFDFRLLIDLLLADFFTDDDLLSLVDVEAALLLDDSERRFRDFGLDDWDRRPLLFEVEVDPLPLLFLPDFLDDVETDESPAAILDLDSYFRSQSNYTRLD